MTKDEIANKFAEWINQKPGLDWYNYQDRNLINREYKTIAKQKRRAEQALDLFRKLPYSEEIMKDAMRAFGGRLSFDDNGNLQYIEIQYWPTEYRLVAAVVLESYAFYTCRNDINSARLALDMLNPRLRWQLASKLVGWSEKLNRAKDDQYWAIQHRVYDEIERMCKGNEVLFACALALLDEYRKS